MHDIHRNLLEHYATPPDRAEHKFEQNCARHLSQRPALYRYIYKKITLLSYFECGGEGAGRGREGSSPNRGWRKFCRFKGSVSVPVPVHQRASLKRRNRKGFGSPLSYPYAT